MSDLRVTPGQVIMKLELMKIRKTPGPDEPPSQDYEDDASNKCSLHMKRNLKGRGKLLAASDLTGPLA